MSVVDIKVPSIGESITEVTLSKWLKADGDIVKVDEPICEFESDKATLEFPAEVSGKLTLIAKEGDDLKIGQLMARIDTSVSEPSATQATTSASAPQQTISTPENPTFSNVAGHPSPAAAKMMAESNIDASQITATGKDGRIRKEDVQVAQEKIITEEPKTVVEAAPKAAEPTTSSPLTAFSRSVRKEKMTRMRRTIAARLVSAKNNTAMLTTFNEVDMTALMDLRKNYQDRFVEKFGIKLGFMSLFAKACAKVLLEMPEVNARIEDDSLVFHDYADVSIAISTPTGLVVPPVHNTESLSLAEIEFKIKELADKARTGKLTLEEMTGGTFTITNGGVFGSMMSTPILNEPQSAILGMHAIINRPVAVNNEMMIRPMMYIALSYDHRVIDGSSSVTFLVRVKKLLEDPVSLLLDL